MKYILFLIIILLSNIIQGITGFAGTILAMPPSLMLVGYETAKPILNILGILAGVYVLITCFRHVCWKELKKIIIIMIIGIFIGIILKSSLADKEQILYKILGIFVVILAIQGFYRTYNGHEYGAKKDISEISSYLLLISAGIVHGMFVCGGPLLIGYLSKKIHEKTSFRATISTVWIILNSIIMLDDMRIGLLNYENLKLLILTIPFLILGMFIGTKLCYKMSQKLFMNITYILLVISGLSLIIK